MSSSPRLADDPAEEPTSAPSARRRGAASPTPLDDPGLQGLARAAWLLVHTSTGEALGLYASREIAYAWARFFRLHRVIGPNDYHVRGHSLQTEPPAGFL